MEFLVIIFLIFYLLNHLQENCVSGCMKSSDPTKNVGSYDAFTPSPRKEAWWLEKHLSHVEHSQKNFENIKLLFLGDSITHEWNEDGNYTFHKYYAKYNAANYGVPADRTQHLLWRIRNGEIHNLNPLMVVLLIGTNNFGHNKDMEIFKGVKAIVIELRRRLPHSKILLLGILPRSTDTATKRVNAINKLIMQLDDDLMVWFFDLGRYFYIEDHLVTELYHQDLLHLSSKGYETWAFAMAPVMREMMEIIFESE
ncbi:platelet-activating factor acetylhydrolase IB subunit gamma [Folsomia candida]|uniref:Platelet-activating factor acetylhydrolase IB subunit gamma n=1 Tax=Folsomia candida TaxID=158441 RepID=A0A226ETT0_FOLCA|nr:platelet-activating factor acetylhydrolase IB subunit gamma [Folsomia candida]OXA61025.1 Platelet-activating factor acetylhydrolase IB subunit gamma [Folsomia candida]